MKTKIPKKKLSSGRKTIQEQLRAIYNASIEENRIVTLKIEKEANDAEQEERIIQRRLEDDRREGERRKEERR